MNKQIRRYIAAALLGLLQSSVVSAEDYMDQTSFLAQAFADDIPPAQKYWLKNEDDDVAQRIMGHSLDALRIRYWAKGTKSVWILDEIGKLKPITIGVVIDNNTIASLNILAFRESRGWEIKLPFFTSQFIGLSLTNNYELSDHIDNITGATLSVRAATNVASMALYFSQKITLDTVTHAKKIEQDPSTPN